VVWQEAILGRPIYHASSLGCLEPQVEIHGPSAEAL